MERPYRDFNARLFLLEAIFAVGHHGSVDGDPDRLVVTDEDFGRVYLTEGWATRFLLGLFQNQTVLLIGYSHEDTIRLFGPGPTADPNVMR